MVQKVHEAALSITECRTEKEIRERGKGTAVWKEEGRREHGGEAHAVPLSVEGKSGL